MEHSYRSPRVARRVVACVAIGVLFVSCGDDDSATSGDVATTGEVVTTSAAPAADSTAAESDTSPSGDVCADREALRSSVDALQDVDLVAEGTSGVTEAIIAVKDDLAALRASAGSELEPDVQAVQDAIDELETALGNLDSGGAAQAVAAATDLASSAGTLLDSLEDGACGPSTTT